MKIITKEYKKQIRQLMRRRSYCRIVFKNINTSCALDGSWSDNGSLDYSNKTQLDNINHTYGDTIGNLDLNRWELDKDCIVEKSTINDGFIADKLSDNIGDLSTSVILTREFTQTYDIPGLTLIFDSRLCTFPKEVKISYYANSTLIKEQTFEPYDYTLSAQYPCQGVDKIVLTISKVLPYSHFRLQTVLFGIIKTFTNEDITTCKQDHDVDPLARRVPTEKLQFTIIDKNKEYDPENPEGLWAYIDKHAPVEISYGYELEDGSVEWLAPDCYVLDGRPSLVNNLATFTGISNLKVSNRKYYKDTYGTKTLYSMAIAVLEDMGLTPFGGQNPWFVDTSLQNISTTGVLPIDTHINCLQMIAHAARCKLYTNDQNVIRIEPFSTRTKDSYKGTYTDNGHLTYSNINDLDKDILLPNTYVDLELNRQILNNENQIINQDNSALGFISNKLSKADGTFDTNPLITRVFDTPRDLGVVQLSFDRVLDEYPREVVVRYYDVDNVLLDTQTETINSYEFKVISTLALDVKKCEIEFTKTLPYSYVRLEKISFRENDFVMNYTTIKQKTEKLSKIEELKTISVSQYSNKVSSSATEIYNESTTLENLHLDFDGIYTNVSVSVSGGSATTQNIYGRALDLVLTSGTKTIVVTGKKVEEVKTINSYSISNDGEEDEEDNILITSKAQADALANHISTYITMRNTYDVTYRGNPELETGDLIGLQTPYTDSMDVIVLTDSITFNGALSGTMKLKGVI